MKSLREIMRSPPKLRTHLVYPCQQRERGVCSLPLPCGSLLHDSFSYVPEVACYPAGQTRRSAPTGKAV